MFDNIFKHILRAFTTLHWSGHNIRKSNLLWIYEIYFELFLSFWDSPMCRGPHRYTRTVRVPIPRPKIPVINRIDSSPYFFTGTMNKMPRCWYSRQGGKECRDAESAGKYIAIASSSDGSHFNCTTIDTNARSSTWKSVERATLCILHGASPAPPHFSEH